MRAQPKSVEILHSLGEVLQHQQEWSQARRVFATIVDLNPSDVKGFVGLGEALHRLGKHKVLQIGQWLAFI